MWPYSAVEHAKCILSKQSTETVANGFTDILNWLIGNEMVYGLDGIAQS